MGMVKVDCHGDGYGDESQVPLQCNLEILLRQNTENTGTSCYSQPRPDATLTPRGLPLFAFLSMDTTDIEIANQTFRSGHLVYTDNTASCIWVGTSRIPRSNAPEPTDTQPYLRRKSCQLRRNQRLHSKCHTQD